MSQLKICRICLRTEAKVYKFDRFHLMSFYEEVMAVKMDEKDGLPLYFCYECATLLHKFHKFKEKCYRGQKTLKEMLWKGPITYELVYKIDTKAANLKSPLQILTVNERIKTYITKDNTEVQDDDVKDEQPIQNRQLKRKQSYQSSISEYDCSNEQEMDIPDESMDDEKPLLSFNDIDIVIKEPHSPTTIFIDEKKEVVQLKHEIIKDGKQTVNSTPKTRKHKFNLKKQAKFLDANHWEKVNLTEEEAVQEFRARAQNKKFLAAQYNCMDCFRGFSKKDMLDRHVQLRHTEGVNECRFCRMRFKWDCLLRKHMRQHFTKYKCLRCDLVCPLENSALLHEDYHNGITKKCIHCNEEFRHMSTYYTHLRTHRSEFVCALCGLSFVSEAGLHQHKKVKHVNKDDDIVESPEDDEPLNTFCARCDITFSSRKAYVEHVFHSAMHADGMEDELEDEYTWPRKVLGKKKQRKVSKAESTMNKFDGLFQRS